MSGRRADNRKKSQMKTSHFSFKITFEKREERRKLRIKIFFLLTFKSSWHRILRSRISFHVNFQRKKWISTKTNQLRRSADSILPHTNLSDPQPGQRTPAPEPGKFPPRLASLRLWLRHWPSTGATNEVMSLRSMTSLPQPRHIALLSVSLSFYLSIKIFNIIELLSFSASLDERFWEQSFV